MSTLVQQMWAAGAMVANPELNDIMPTFNTEYKLGVKQGDTVKIRVAGVVVAEDGKTTQAGTGVVTDKAVIDMVFDQQTKAPVFISRMDDAQTDIPMITFWSGEIKKAVNDLMNKNAMSEAATTCATANKKKFSELVTDATTLTYAGLVALEKILDDGKFPITDRTLVIPPKYKAAMMQMVDPAGNLVLLSKNYTNGENSLITGEVGKAMSFTVIVSTNMPTLTTTGTIDGATPANNIKECILAYHKSAFAAGIQEDMWFEDYPDGTNIGTKIVGGSYWGRKMLRPTGMVCVRDN